MMKVNGLNFWNFEGMNLVWNSDGIENLKICLLGIWNFGEFFVFLVNFWIVVFLGEI